MWSKMNPLKKVFTVIETVVSRQDRGATYSEILKDVDLPKSTVHRILKDLTDLDYFSYDAATRRYYGSLRFAALGAHVMTNFRLRDHIHPFLLELQHDTKHTANLGILDGTQGVFIDKIESRDFAIKLFSEIGKPFPLHCTSLGKTLLAFSPPAILEKLLEQPLKAETEQTITDPDQLKIELRRVIRQGYAVDNEEITRGIVCVGGPIFDFEQRIQGAISIAFPAYIKQDRGIEAEIAAIKNYAESISKSLGGRFTAVPYST
jgi:IclR family transcriptional regulator, KDG regulon repressor